MRTPLTALRLDAEALRDQADGGPDRCADVAALDDAVTRSITRTPGARRDRPCCDATEVVAERIRVLVGARRGPAAAGRRRTCRPGRCRCAVAAGRPGRRAWTRCWATSSRTPRRDGVAVACDPRAAARSLTVADAGPGIPIRRAGARGSSGAGSTGLGLDIARRTAEAAGGTCPGPCTRRRRGHRGPRATGLPPRSALAPCPRHRRAGTKTGARAEPARLLDSSPRREGPGIAAKTEHATVVPEGEPVERTPDDQDPRSRSPRRRRHPRRASALPHRRQRRRGRGPVGQRRADTRAAASPVPRRPPATAPDGGRERRRQQQGSRAATPTGRRHRDQVERDTEHARTARARAPAAAPGPPRRTRHRARAATRAAQSGRRPGPGARRPARRRRATGATTGRRPRRRPRWSPRQRRRPGHDGVDDKGGDR